MHSGNFRIGKLVVVALAVYVAVDGLYDVAA